MSEKAILVVDDCENDVQLLLRSFRIAKLTNPVRVVDNGEDAIRYLAGDTPFVDRNKYPMPSLVLLDIGIPGLDGFEVLAWARARPDIGDVTIAVLTGSDCPRHVRQAYELGAAAFLIKPLPCDGMNDLVANLDRN